MSDLPIDLAAVLQQVSRPGDFYAAGTIDIHTPRLEVDGVGPIALPLLPVQAAQLLEVAEQAPYGRGTETLVDTDVRRTWQIDADRLHIAGRHWEEDLDRILRRVTDGLGVAGQVRAEPYKLLVYDTGSFFLTHRDTEKAPGMFATLVIVLPCHYGGGELLIRHKGREVRLDLRPADPAEAAFAAFYADCRHEVLPVTAGHRLTLIYNLLREGGGPLPEPPDYEPQLAQATELLRAWALAADVPDAGGEPGKLVYPLEHAYTEAELGFDTLKGADAAAAALLMGAATATACDLHLALLSIEESGWAEYVGGRRGQEQYEVGEVTDSSRTLHDWRHPDGGRPALGPLPFDEAEVCPPGALDDAEDEEPEFEEATGNEGASFERFYQCAALVLWPETARSRILVRGGLDVAVPFLGELVRRWEATGRRPEDATRRDALALAAAIRQTWPSDPWARRSASKEGHGGALLDALARLGDPEQCAEFLVEQTLTGAYGPADNPAIAAVLRQLPPVRAGGLLKALVANNAAVQPGGCARLLLLCTESPPLPAGTLRPAGKALIAALAGYTPGAAPQAFGGQLPTAPTPELVTDTLTALERIDPELAAQALDQLLAMRAIYPMDALLLPAALALLRMAPDGRPGSFESLRLAVLAHLGRRIAEPLEPPTDWTRPAEVRCGCTYCVALNRFLAASDMREWRLKAVQRDRTHVEQTIGQHRCDLDLATERRGSPHTLICTKNQASYERRVQQRRQDLEHRAQLGG